MIYLDHAATSFPKPQASTEAMCMASRSCAGYGRSGHSAARRASEIVFECRDELAGMFGAPSPNHVAFTMNATLALNYAIHALIPNGSSVVVSAYEHNSVIRPLAARNCKIIPVAFDAQNAENIWEEHIRRHPACVVVNHASNAFGVIQPIELIGRLCARYHVPMIVDASQSAGILEVDISKIPNCAAVCMPGHKGLWGPQGTGVMVFTDLLPRSALLTGGTGSQSVLLQQPKEIPDLFESGTINLPGIAGLLESVKMVRRIGLDEIRKHESALCDRLRENLDQIAGIHAAGVHAKDEKTGILSIVSEKASCGTIGELLAEKDVCVRTGLHCAPLAHKTEGTLKTGTIRFSLGWTNTVYDVDMAAEILETIMKSF